jgi:hypothetical protein
LTDQQQKEQFQSWLIVYINGRLGKADCVWMEQYVAEHPYAATELELERALKNSLQSELPEFAPNHGLDTFMSRVRSETQSSHTSSNAVSKQNIISRMKVAVYGLFLDPKWAIAVTLLLVQTSVITLLLSNSKVSLILDQSEWRSVGEKPQVKGPVLQITFKASAKEEDMRLLLVKIRGSLVGGPGQLGSYFVKVPDEYLEAAKQQVANSSIIESVQILSELPIEH